jgi:hypothetical protein
VSFLGEVYKNVFEEKFKDHPKKDEIVAKLVDGDLDPVLVDLYFTEAEIFTHEAIKEAITKAEPDENGYITFKVVD